MEIGGYVSEEEIRIALLLLGVALVVAVFLVFLDFAKYCCAFLYRKIKMSHFYLPVSLALGWLALKGFQK